tara:strand:+ start:428 stop:1834 length:1407 start_codon:yes stop_codon:yes gene_type:complete
MAEITQTRTLPAEFIEALGKTYADQLTKTAGTAVDTSKFAPTIAAQDPLQTQAASLASSGVGSYQPFVTAAQQAATDAQTTLAGVPSAISTADLRLGQVPSYISAAGAGLGTAGTELTGAGTTLGGVSNFLGAAQGLTGTGAGTGAGSIASYMSPYQQQVIDTTLTEFDRQAQAQRSQQAAQALGVPGAFGGGREGVLQAEFLTGSDRNRAALQSGLLQQGFQQAAGLRQQDLANQMGLGQAQQSLAAQQAAFAGQRADLGQAQLGLGSAEQSLAQSALGLGSARQSLAQSQLGQGGFQQGLASLVPQLRSQDISTLGSIGSAQQAFAQAQIDAANAAAREAAYEPVNRSQMFGQGVTGLMGGYPAAGSVSQSQPSPGILQSAIGAGATFAGIYGGLKNSDVRLKEDINLIGKSPSGFNVYTFKYKGDDKGVYQGVMAQEVPHASILGKDGFYKVDYSKVDVEFKKVN